MRTYYKTPQFYCKNCRNEIFTDPVIVGTRELCPTCAQIRSEAGRRFTQRRQGGRRGPGLKLGGRK